MRNVTLHNIDQIKKLDIHIGDTLVLERAGEVIPYVREALPEKRPKDAKAIHPPKKCPSCGTPVEREEDTPYIRCPNPDCPAQFLERVKWFCGRNQMDISDLGDRLISQLVAAGRLKRFGDLFRLGRDDIAKLESVVVQRGKETTRHVGIKIADKILKSAEAAKQRGLDRLLAGLGIPHVGNTVARDVALWAGSINRLLKASEEEIRFAISFGSDVEKASEAQRKDENARTASNTLVDALAHLPKQTHGGLIAITDSEKLRTFIVELAESGGFDAKFRGAKKGRAQALWRISLNRERAFAKRHSRRRIWCAYESGHCQVVTTLP